jgi:hypothetical protein
VADLVREYRCRCERSGAASAAARQWARDSVFRDAGGLTYDHVQGEFGRLARGLGWPPAATVKDLRHLFATTMNNACMPEAYRKYLMGHSPGRASVVAYTHLHELRRHYSDAVRKEWSPIVTAINRRVVELAGPAP